LIERTECLEGQIKAWRATNRVSQRLASIPGIGVLTASAALTAMVCEDRDFRNGRQLADHLGLVPCQVSSGGRRGYWVLASGATVTCVAY
jgi:transposase